MSIAIHAYRRAYAHPAVRRFLEVSGLHHVLGILRIRSKWLGVPGALKFSVLALLGVKKPIQFQVIAWNQPMLLRPRSTDLHVLGEIVDGAYRLDPPAARCAFIVDAGANIGAASRYFAREYPEARIVAIEPASENFAVLSRNMAPCPRIRAKQAGLWPQSGPLRLSTGTSEAWAFQVETCEPSEADFEGITVPQLLTEFGMERIDILKIDIEGSEWPLFFNAPTDWLDRVEMLLIEFHPGGDMDLVARACKIIGSHGLQSTQIRPSIYIFRRPTSP